MKFYVLKVITDTDNNTTKSVYEYDDEKSAIASVHSEYSKYLKLDTSKEILCMMINSNGGVHENLYWKNPDKDPVIDEPIIDETVVENGIESEIKTMELEDDRQHD